jgi:carbohydrate-selective porin OprB
MAGSTIRRNGTIGEVTITASHVSEVDARGVPGVSPVWRAVCVVAVAMTGTTRHRVRSVGLCAALALLVLSGTARSQLPAAMPQEQAAPVNPTDATAGFWTRATMAGDMGGLRGLLGRAGLTLTLVDQNEVLGNLTGGLKRGATYDGLTTLTLGLDTQRAFGWEGGTITVSALETRGRSALFITEAQYWRRRTAIPRQSDRTKPSSS